MTGTTDAPEVQLTESLEDYLEVIAELIAVEGHAHAKNIAERLHVKMPSVTGALRQLEKLKLIVYNTHYPVELTEEGARLASDVMHRHKVLKGFFSEILGLDPQKATSTACRIEHAVDHEIIARFVLFSEAITTRSDARQLQTYLAEAMRKPDCCAVLSSLSPGDRGTVDSFGGNLKNPEKLGIREGDEIELAGFSLDRRMCRILFQGTEILMTLQDAENLWIRRS